MAEAATTGPMDLAPGTVIDGKLEVVRTIGVGGMGAVVAARNVRTGRLVAVKVLRRELASDADLARRFLNEALACGRIRHKNVVDVLDAGVHDGRPYIVMELLDGESLGARVARTRPIPVDTAVGWGLEACAGLAAAHAAGIIHRDLKPENLFLAVTHEGEEVLKVVDFGISKLIDDPEKLHTTQTGVVVGTPLFMSPEQSRGVRDVDARTDVWAVGSVLYDALTGRPPFVADNYNALIFALLSAEVTPVRQLRADVPDAIATVIMKALAKERDLRYATIAELANTLAAAAGRPSPLLGSARGARGDAALAATVSSGATPKPAAAALASVTPTTAIREPAAATPAAAALAPTPIPVAVAGGARGGPRAAPWIAIAALALVVGVGAVAYSAWPGGAEPSAETAPERAAAPAAAGSAQQETTEMAEMVVDVAAPELAPRRVAVIATAEPAAAADPAITWPLVARVVELLDRYEELRPTSPAGLLAARVAEVGDRTTLPDELMAARIARRVGAGTVVTLGVMPMNGGVRVAPRVYATESISTDAVEDDEWVAGRVETLTMSELDTTGPARIATAVSDAVQRRLGLSSLSAPSFERSDAMFARCASVAEAEALTAIGDYETSLAILDRLAQETPDDAIIHALRACDLSYLGRDEAALRAVERAAELRESVRSRRDSLRVEQDLTFVRAAQARDAGRMDESRRLARELLGVDLELAHEYGEPLGYLYAAAAQQWLLEDPAAARQTYADARGLAPWLYPPYHEEAKLVLGDGASPSAQAEAARIISTYLQCNPGGVMVPRARAFLSAHHLTEVRERLPCPTMGGH